MDREFTPVMPSAEAELRAAASSLRAMARHLGDPAFLANVQSWVQAEAYAASLDLINADRAMQVLGGGDRCGRSTLIAAVKAGVIEEYRVASGVRYSRAAIEQAVREGRMRVLTK